MRSVTIVSTSCAGAARVVPDIVQKRCRRSFGLCRQKHCRARHSARKSGFDKCRCRDDQVGERKHLPRVLAQRVAAFLPRGHLQKHDRANGKRQPFAGEHFEAVTGKERSFHHERNSAKCSSSNTAPFPHAPSCKIKQEGGCQHSEVTAIP